MSRPLEIFDWAGLDEPRRQAILRRPAQRDAANVLERVRRIVDDVRARGDEALREYSRTLDRVRLESFEVAPDEFEMLKATTVETAGVVVPWANEADAQRLSAQSAMTGRKKDIGSVAPGAGIRPATVSRGLCRS